jgi:hypothetical protein
MNIELAKKYIQEAMDTVYKTHCESLVYNDGYSKLLKLALHELESPVVQKSNGYCSKCLWPDTQCKCPSKGYPTVIEKSEMKIRPEDFQTEIVDKRSINSFGRSARSVKVTHIPTGIWDARLAEISEHAAKNVAWGTVMNAIKAQGWTE